MATYEAPSHASISVGTSEVEVTAGSSNMDIVIQQQGTGNLAVGLTTGVEVGTPSSGLGGIELTENDSLSIRVQAGETIYLLADASSQDVRLLFQPASL